MASNYGIGSQEQMPKKNIVDKFFDAITPAPKAPAKPVPHQQPSVPGNGYANQLGNKLRDRKRMLDSLE